MVTNLVNEACENWFSLIASQNVEEAMAAVITFEGCKK
jgi:hypothetical protein